MKKVTDFLFTVFEILILSIVWSGSGYIIGSGYIWLAGGSLKDFSMVGVLSPVIVVLLILLNVIYKRIPSRTIPWDFKKWCRIAYWIIVGYFSLPVVCHGLSKLLKWQDQQTLGNFFYHYRYGSLFWVPILLLVAIVVRMVVIKLYQRSCKKSTPPPAIPPDGEDDSAEQPDKIDPSTTL